MTINFDDLSAPSEPRPRKDGGVRKAGILALQSPCLNSLELHVRGLIATETVLQVNVDFVSDEGLVEADSQGAFAAQIPQSDDLNNIKRIVWGHLSWHASACRSLGPHATVAQYLALCEREGVKPIGFPPEYR